MTLRALVCEALAMPGGAGAKEIKAHSGISNQAMSITMVALEHQRRAFRRPIDERWSLLRWFPTQALADAWAPPIMGRPPVPQCLPNKDRARIEAFCKRPEGGSRSEIAAMGVRMNGISEHMKALCGNGRAYRSLVAGQGLRWFGTAAEALARDMAPTTGDKSSAELPLNKGGRPRKTTTHQGAKPPRLKGSTYAGTTISEPRGRSPVGPVDNSRAVYTFADKPHAIHAYQLLPDEPPLFSSLGIGRYFDAGHSA